MIPLDAADFVDIRHQFEIYAIIIEENRKIS